MRVLRRLGTRGAGRHGPAPGRPRPPAAAVPSRRRFSGTCARGPVRVERSRQSGSTSPPLLAPRRRPAAAPRRVLPYRRRGAARGRAATPRATGPPGTRCSTCSRASISGSRRDGFSVAARALSGYDSALGETVADDRRDGGSDAGSDRRGRHGCCGSRRVARAAPACLWAQGWAAELAFDRLVLEPTRPRRRAAGVGRCSGAEGEGQWGRWRLRWRPEPRRDRQERGGLTAWFASAPLVVRGWTRRRADPSARRHRPPAPGALLSGCAGPAKPPGRLAGGRRSRRRRVDSGRLPLRRPPSGTGNGGTARRC